MVGEAIKSVLFPLKWQCTDIPMCPLSLATYIQAPVPFIIGIDSRYMMMAEEFPDDVAFVDLVCMFVIWSEPQIGCGGRLFAMLR